MSTTMPAIIPMSTTSIMSYLIFLRSQYISWDLWDLVNPHDYSKSQRPDFLRSQYFVEISEIHISIGGPTFFEIFEIQTNLISPATSCFIQRYSNCHFWDGLKQRLKHIVRASDFENYRPSICQVCTASASFWTNFWTCFFALTGALVVATMHVAMMRY